VSRRLRMGLVTLACCVAPWVAQAELTYGQKPPSKEPTACRTQWVWRADCRK
jgi:hypothetical protein